MWEADEQINVVLPAVRSIESFSIVRVWDPNGCTEDFRDDIMSLSATVTLNPVTSDALTGSNSPS